MKFVTRCTLTGLGTVAIFAACAAAATPVRAEYPERNITVIVPFPAGGASDMTARLITGKLAERVKQTVVIDNRAAPMARSARWRSSRRPPTATRC